MQENTAVINENNEDMDSENNMVLNRKLINIKQNSKYGYEIRTEEIYWDNEKPFIMKSGYTFNGDYIGDEKITKFLCEKKLIAPEKINSSDSVCSIGYSVKRNKWAGWSHRAYAEFGIGSTVQKGDVAYVPRNKEDFIENLKNFYKDEEIDIKNQDNKISVFFKQDGIGEDYIIDETFFGKGEWTAKTIEDAKEMAIAFANNIG